MRKLIRTAALSVIVIVGSTAALALAAKAPSPGDQRAPSPTSAQLSAASNFTYQQAQSFSSWSLYDATTSFEGTGMSDVLRRNDPTTYNADSLLDSSGANYVSFLYGDCVAASATGCPMPLEIQVWPACSRNLEGQAVEGVDVRAIRDETLSIRGVPAYFYEEWTRLEFTAGNARVVLFGEGRDQLLRAAASLRGVNNGLPATSNFPTPVECL